MSLIEEVQRVLEAVRLVIYVWLVFELALTGFVYDAANKVMKSEIVCALSRMFIAMTVWIICAATLPFLHLINQDIYLIAATLMSIPALYVIFAIRTFRSKSMGNNHTLKKVVTDVNKAKEKLNGKS